MFFLYYTPQDGANNKVYVMASGTFGQDDSNGAVAYMKIDCSGQHSTPVPGSSVGTDQVYLWHSYCVFLRDPNISNNTAQNYIFQVRTGNSSSDWRPQTSMSLTVIEVAAGVDQTA